MLNEFKKEIETKIAQAHPQNRFEIISELSELLDKLLKKDNPEKKEIVLNAIKKILEKNKQGNMVLAQINPLPGCVEKNAIKAMTYILAAEKIGADAIIFPELTLLGYPIHDTIDRHPVIVEENVKWIKQIAKKTGKTTVIIGLVEPRKDGRVGKQYYNSVAVLKDGKIQGIVRKSLLPTYSEFNDYRYFEPSPVVGIQPAETLCDFGKEKIVECDKLIEIAGKKCGIVVCEDGWSDKNFFSNPLYEIDPVEELAKAGAEIIINCSASPTRSKKEQLKHNMLSFVAQRHKVAMVYTNQVGAIDECSSEGSSRIYDKKGKLRARAKSFEEQFFICNPITSEGTHHRLTKGLEKTLKSQKVFSLDYEPDLERTYKTIVQGIRDYFTKNGLQKAVLGLSGGLDSTICAVLVADALGKENVFGVSMPSKLTSKESKIDAEILANNLGINFAEASIKPMVDNMIEQLEPLFEKVAKKWDNGYKESYVMDNIQARSRAVLLWGIANKFSHTVPIATSDKSELYMGYATINGDMSGGFAPIADVPKTKLFALASWMNEHRKVKNAIPEDIIKKPPGAELAIDPTTGKPLRAEDALMPYEFMDEVIWRIENKHESYYDMLHSEFLYETKQKISKEQKTIWLDKFYARMSTALYKWSILPPSVIVEGRSILKADYKQPITSGKIDYKGQSEDVIAKKLEI